MPGTVHLNTIRYTSDYLKHTIQLLINKPFSNHLVTSRQMFRRICSIIRYTKLHYSCEVNIKYNFTFILDAHTSKFSSLLIKQVQGSIIPRNGFKIHLATASTKLLPFTLMYVPEFQNNSKAFLQMCNSFKFDLKTD